MVQPACGYRPFDTPADPCIDDPFAGQPLAVTTGAEADPVAALALQPTPRSEAERVIQQRLDAFRAAMSALYRTTMGQATVPAAFAMVGSTAPAAVDVPVPVARNTPAASARMQQDTTSADLQSAAMRAHVQFALRHIRSGRGTPEQIQAITQALIDEGHEAPQSGRSIPAAVRHTMANYGIGIDCAGYAQQAYLFATGLDRAGACFADIAHEDLSHLERRGYVRVADLADVRAGDLVVLGPPPPQKADPHPVGHRAIVYNQRLANAADMQQLFETRGGADMASGGPIRVFDVDSSWGCQGNAEVGGVQRERWWYNESTRQWGWQDQSKYRWSRPVHVGSAPYGHPCDSPAEGFFRDPRRGS